MSCYVSVVCDLFLFACSYHQLLETFLQFFAIFNQIEGIQLPWPGNWKNI